MAKCDCYFQHGTKFLCYGTKEMEECSCGGDESKCNFYPEKRKPKMANEKRLIDVNKVIRSMQTVLDEEKHNKNSVAYFAFESIIECLKQEPTVDAVEVVCCENCVSHEDCFFERVLQILGYKKPFCCAGKTDGD